MGAGTREVWLVGRQRFQGELLCLYLEERLGCHSRYLPLQTVDPADLHAPSRQLLVLIDCAGSDCEPLLRLLRERPPGTAGTTLALLNVDIAGEIEPQALALGVRGFFYADDPGEVFPKGVEALFNGEIWLSRRKMETMLLQRHRLAMMPGQGPGLTPREEEILVLVASGVTNSAIADRLCISHHTVRTHIYKIFQKIEVPNRFQAALWAAQNL